MMNFIYELGRWIGVISGLPIQWILFKRKNYYESENAKTRHHEGAALVILNHFNPLDFIWSVLAFSPANCTWWRRNTLFAILCCDSV